MCAASTIHVSQKVNVGHFSLLDYNLNSNQTEIFQGITNLFLIQTGCLRKVH